jgi:hypothetical protein
MPRKLVPFGVVAILFVVAALSVQNTSAASQTANLSFSGTGSATTLLDGIAVCDECAPDDLFSDPSGILNTWGLGAGVHIGATASWNAPAGVGLQYSAGNLRHGATLDLADTLTPGQGTIKIDYLITGTLGVYGTPQTGDLSCAALASSCNGWVPTTDTVSLNIPASDNIACTMPLPGESPRDCSNTKTITLWSGDFLSIAGAEVDLVLDETVTVTGSGVTSLRIAMVSGGDPIPNETLTFSGSSPSTVSDPIFISCSQPVGTDLLYQLGGDYSAEPATYAGDVKLHAEAHFLFIEPSIDLTLLSVSGPDLGPIPMSAPSQQVDLGPVLKNNVPPVVNPGGPYSGVEGTPVTFDGTGSSSVCGFPTLVWNFSDGGVAYGAMPQHTFEAPGIYSGLLTASDSDGNVSTATFSVSIANLAPVADAGPDMSTAWGLPVTLNGSAVDPGTAEQPFLTYRWDFGDGTPSASGGGSVQHVYSSPGTYTATFSACDPESACNSDTTQVVVRMRGTTLSYTGALQSLPSKYVSLSASLVDEYGQPVVGRLVTFALMAEDGSVLETATATTDAAGSAATTMLVKQKPGSYLIKAEFAGDVMYSSSDAGPWPYKVGK